jgi:transcriptional regulator with XRE-family HTH domain
MVYVSGPTEKHSITSLADYVRSVRNEKNLSLTQVSSRSHGGIGKTHINRIENGTVVRVSLMKLQALALGLDVPEDDLIAVAQGKPPLNHATQNERELLSYFRQLSAAHKEDVLGTVQALTKRVSAKANKRSQGAAVK